MNTEFDYSHLRIAREQLGLTQKEAANASGISQRDISQLESGLKKFFPLAYILFLNVNGVNLNILFSNNLNIQNLISDRLGRIQSINPETIQFEYSVFKIARERAGYTQKQASIRSGLSQRDISQLEAGLKKFIPFQFIQYLIQLKADLNELFKLKSPQSITSAPTPTTLDFAPKKAEFTPQNKAPENRVFERQLAIDTEYSTDKASEISVEKEVEVSPVSTQSVNILSSNHERIKTDDKPEILEVKSREETPKFVEVKSTPIETTELPPIAKKNKQSGIALVDKRQLKEYIQNSDSSNFINSLPTLSIPGIETGLFRAFEISGREMEPLFFEGDIAIGLKTEDYQEIKNNRLYILVSEKRILLRRIINCIKASNELILLTDNETIANEVMKVNELKEVWEFNVKITSSVDQLKNSFNELYFQLLKIQKDLDTIKSKL